MINIKRQPTKQPATQPTSFLNKTCTQLLLIGAIGFIFSETVQAQWIFVAHRLEGRINELTQDDENGKPATQFATVIIDAPANKVYATAVNVASQNPAVTIASQDPQALKLKVSEGSKSASLNVVALNEQSSEIMIAAPAAAPGQDPTTSIVMKSILKICAQMNKVCQVGAK